MSLELGNVFTISKDNLDHAMLGLWLTCSRSWAVLQLSCYIITSG